MSDTVHETKAVTVPKAAKKPQDRKPKAEPEPDHKVVNVRGRDWSIPTAATDDFELLDDLNALDQQQDMTRMPSILRRLIGDQWRDAMVALRDGDTGRVAVEDAAEFVEEIMEAFAPNS